MDQLDNIINQGFSFLQTGVGYDLLIEFSGAFLFTVCGFIFLWARRSLGPQPHIEDFYRALSEILHLLHSAKSENQDAEISEKEDEKKVSMRVRRESEISVMMNKIIWLTGQFSAASIINQFSKKNQKIIEEIQSKLEQFRDEFAGRKRRGSRLTEGVIACGKELYDPIDKLSGLPKRHKKELKEQLGKLIKSEGS